MIYNEITKEFIKYSVQSDRQYYKIVQKKIIEKYDIKITLLEIEKILKYYLKAINKASSEKPVRLNHFGFIINRKSYVKLHKKSVKKQK